MWLSDTIQVDVYVCYGFFVSQTFDGIECEWPMFYAYFIIDGNSLHLLF